MIIYIYFKPVESISTPITTSAPERRENENWGT